MNEPTNDNGPVPDSLRSLQEDHVTSLPDEPDQATQVEEDAEDTDWEDDYEEWLRWLVDA